MYSGIKILPTDYDSKYLFINGANIMYGGFVIKDIVEMLKENISNHKIARKIEDKYNIAFDEKMVVDIVEQRIDKHLLAAKKRRSLKRIITYNLRPTFALPNLFRRVFNERLFYPLFFFVLIINTVFYFSKHVVIELSNGLSSLAIIALLIVLIVHEIGHIYAAKSHRVIVPELGIGIYFVLPVLFVNLDEIWRLNRKKRILINLGGIFLQLLLGSVFLLMFSLFDSTFFYYLFQLNFVIIVINLNPLFKFDGYWVLADLLNKGNLSGDAIRYLKNIFKKNQTTPWQVRIYALLKVSLIIYLISFFIKKIIPYVT